MVYLTDGDRWSEDLAEARVLADRPAADRFLAETAAGPIGDTVVGPYALPVSPGPAGVEALSQREHIRRAGPSVRPDLHEQTTRS